MVTLKTKKPLKKRKKKKNPDGNPSAFIGTRHPKIQSMMVLPLNVLLLHLNLPGTVITVLNEKLPKKARPVSCLYEPKDLAREINVDSKTSELLKKELAIYQNAGVLIRI